MKVSGNELSVTVTKACVGAGVARGVAEDIGKAALELALAGEDALSGLLQCLEQWSPKGNAGTEWTEDDSGWHCSHCSVLHNGPALIDCAVLAGVGKYAKAGKVDHIALVRGLALASGWSMTLEPDGANGVVARLTDPQWEERRPVAVNGCDVEEAAWRKVCAYASEILVPADDTNRADAGAGLTDND